MVDIVDKATRSRMMAGIRGRDTKPEMLLRKALHRRGFRFRLHARDAPGRPDLLLPRYRAAIFVHGCFWHRHIGCRYATTPATNPEFWQRKFDSNVERDQRDLKALEAAGWRVAIAWECGFKSIGRDAMADILAGWLTSDCAFLEVPEALHEP